MVCVAEALAYLANKCVLGPKGRIWGLEKLVLECPLSYSGVRALASRMVISDRSSSLIS
jgi:hypothetical protein